MDLSHLYDAVIDGDAEAAARVTEQALESGEAPPDILNEHLIPAMQEVGHRYEAGDYFVPELLMAARAMKAAMAHLRPRLAERGVPPVGRVVIGSVQGDLHDIGKNLVAAMLEGAGFEVIDLGVDVSPETFVKAVRESGARIVALSALLTTTMSAMSSVVDAVREAGLRGRVKVIVGGAPVTQRFADSIGADAWAPNAVAAVRVAREALTM